LADKAGVNYPRLEHCNAFIGDWETQTLFVLFGAPQGNGFAQVKKPVLNLDTMLSLLGDHRLRAPGEAMDNLGVLATRRGEDQMAVLLYHSADDPTARGSAEIQRQLRGVPFEKRPSVGLLGPQRQSVRFGSAPWAKAVTKSWRIPRCGVRLRCRRAASLRKSRMSSRHQTSDVPLI
jgi:hypothetical protein